VIEQEGSLSAALFLVPIPEGKAKPEMGKPQKRGLFLSLFFFASMSHPLADYSAF
jgi:hypothetical protein